MMKLSNIFNKVAVALGATATVALASCSDECPNYWDDFYGPYVPAERVAKPRYIWVDASANFPYLANDRDKIAEYIDKAKTTGFTDIVVDVRPTMGDVLFKTDLVDQAKTLYTWKTDGYGPTTRTVTWDYLQAFIDIGHQAGVRVHAAMNTMVGGTIPPGTQSGIGMLYRDASKRDWATVMNLPGGLTNILDFVPDGLENTKFLNPHHPEVQDFVVGLVEDLAKYSDLDGIILDRGRYYDIRSDFSDITREQFEDYVGEKITNWPDDVLPLGTSSSLSNPTPYYKKWWEFRAKTIHDLIERVSNAVHAVNPNIQFGCYVGAWYGSYYEVGVNWASPNFDPVHVAGYTSWASNDYKNYGYADHIDILILGCYAKPWSVYGTNDWTCQGFAMNGMLRTLGACPLVIGGPDIGNNWPTASANYVFANDPEHANLTEQDYMESAANTVDACINSCGGYFMFDICHLQSSPKYWDALKLGIDRYLEAFNADEK